MKCGTARHVNRTAPRRAVTLIELIAVLGLLAIVVTLAGPSLSPFFRGRGLHEEARRLLALTRYARNEAISRGVPMELWLNTQLGAYGLQAQAGYEFDAEEAPTEFELADGLRLEVDAGRLDTAGIAAIVFLSDGSIEEGSLDSVVVYDEQDYGALKITLADSGLGYEIEEVEEVGTVSKNGR